MGTHPIFESDFDCLTDKMLILSLALGVVVARHGGRKHVQMDRPSAVDGVESLYALQPSDFDVSESEARREYEKFLLKYPKTSSLDPAAAHERFHIFWRNLRRILFYNHIEQGSAVYKVNEFADMSEEEFGEKYLGFSYDGNRKSKKQRFSRGTKLRHIPESFDWTEKGAVTPVCHEPKDGPKWELYNRHS